ncbi:transposase, partial [Chlamydiales bacterium]|nr:transposase [Chlamydiales bacterium]
DIYTDYLICQNHKATATGLSKLLEGDLSHDQITRFLNKEDLTGKELWSYVKPLIRKHEEEGGVFIVDDTIEEKEHTDVNDTVCWHYSHAKGECVKGINILSGMIRYGDFALPVAYEAVRKDLYFCDLSDRKEKRRSTITKNELLRNMLNQSVKNNLKFKYVLADSWFGAKKNMEFIHYDMKKKFIFGIKSNRLVALSEEQRKKGQYQDIKSLNFEDMEERVVWLKDIPFPVKLLTRIFKNENGTSGTLYLATNDINLDADHIYDIYQKRWRIEEYHKSIKQNASLEKSPTKVPRSQRNHIFASIISYCKLEMLKLKTNLNHFGLKYKLIVKANQSSYKELLKIRASA